MTENEIATIVFNAALNVHKQLGPGLLERTYLECLYFELLETGLKVEKEKALPVIYKEVKLDAGYRIDLLIEDKFIIELKVVDTLHEVHFAQLLTYLRLSNCKLGFLINFNVAMLKDGVKRVICGDL